MCTVTHRECHTEWMKNQRVTEWRETTVFINLLGERFSIWWLACLLRENKRFYVCVLSVLQCVLSYLLPKRKDTVSKQQKTSCTYDSWYIGTDAFPETFPEPCSAAVPQPILLMPTGSITLGQHGVNLNLSVSVDKTLCSSEVHYICTVTSPNQSECASW